MQELQEKKKLQEQNENEKGGKKEKIGEPDHLVVGMELLREQSNK